ncbi:MAG TPA: ImmA/IrrE family metallo-endopeptidase [Clostridia bacterium]|nr:ImmA/IrrE family metallo-endopeptidase [Clostridia bacterium]
MAKLHTASNPHEDIGSQEILETLLVEAGTAGLLPTNEKKLLSFLGLQQLSFDFMSEVPFVSKDAAPAGDLRAALHLDEKVVATQSGMGEQRTRFSIFHEIAHCVLPDHFENLFIDTDQTLSWWTKARMEREANQFAADLLFQGKLFTEQALSLPTSLRTVLELAPSFGASYEASLRRFTELHVEPCALIVFQRVPHKEEDGFIEDDEYRVQYTVTSPSFRRLYFSAVQVTGGKCKSEDIFGVRSGWPLSSVVERELTIDRDEQPAWHFATEVFTNSYKIFQFLKHPLSQPQ